MPFLGFGRKDADYWCDQADKAQEHGQYSKALACLDDALRLNPQFTRAYMLRGAVYMRLLRLTDAIEALDAALGLLPLCGDKYAALFAKATLLNQLGRYSAALECVNILLSLEPMEPITSNAYQLKTHIQRH
jgi:tetratricopeptide (TPR) repeat protein